LAQLLNGDREAAVSAFDAVLKNPQALNKDQVLFELAKLAESDEKSDDAVKHYKQLIQEFPLSPLSTEANLRVKVLAPEETQESTESEANTGNEIDQETSENKSGEGGKPQDEGDK
jgi:outer membrane protein assembly factor BamD (BamD/ComL family)